MVDFVIRGFIALKYWINPFQNNAQIISEGVIIMMEDLEDVHRQNPMLHMCFVV